MRALPAMALVLAAASGCGTAAGPGGHACTLIAARTGISIDVAPATASKTSGQGWLEACWAGSCHRQEVALRPSTAPTSSTCGPEVCSGQVSRTGGEYGFVRLPELPSAPVRVTLTLDGPDGEPVVDRTLRVTPEMTHPNGPDCGGGGPQAGLVVGPDGQVRAA